MKNQLIGIGAAIAVAGLISLFTARRIEAQYASPVRVTNTTSAPAIGSLTDERGRIPYQSTATGTFVGGGGCFAHSNCQFNFAQVPAGHRLVVEQLSGQLQYTASPSGSNVFIGYGDNGSATILGGLFAPLMGAPTQTSSFDHPLKGFVEPGQSPFATAFVTDNSPTLGSQLQMTLIGYLLDCTAAPCRAITQ
jgi:hypothetical protein